MTDDDLKLLAETHHEIADAVRQKGYFYGTVSGDLFEKLIERVRVQARVEITEEMVERARVALHDLRYERLKRMLAGDRRALGEWMEGDPPPMQEDAQVALTAALSGGTPHD